MPSNRAPRVKLVVEHPRNELSTAELRSLFHRYFAAQKEIEAHESAINKLKAERSELVRAIVEDRGVSTYEFNEDGVTHRLTPVQYGPHYKFQTPAIATLHV
jgi:hypothetical protein